MDRAPLETWVHKDGKVALLGDACHPMLVRTLSHEMSQLMIPYTRSQPYRAQGTAMAVSDDINLACSMALTFIGTDRRRRHPRKPLFAAFPPGSHYAATARLRTTSIQTYDGDPGIS